MQFTYARIIASKTGECSAFRLRTASLPPHSGNKCARVNRDQSSRAAEPQARRTHATFVGLLHRLNGFNSSAIETCNWPSCSSNRFILSILQVQPLNSNAHTSVCLTITDSSSTNTTENPSPSLSPPPSATKTSPLHSATSSYHLNTSNESDDDGQDCMDDDADDDNPDRPSDGGSPGMNGSMQSKRKKKTRTVFSRAQVFQLESTFDCKR